MKKQFFVILIAIFTFAQETFANAGDLPLGPAPTKQSETASEFETGLHNGSIKMNVTVADFDAYGIRIINSALQITTVTQQWVNQKYHESTTCYLQDVFDTSALTTVSRGGKIVEDHLKKVDTALILCFLLTEKDQQFLGFDARLVNQYIGVQKQFCRNWLPLPRFYQAAVQTVTQYRDSIAYQYVPYEVEKVETLYVDRPYAEYYPVYQDYYYQQPNYSSYGCYDYGASFSLNWTWGYSGYYSHCYSCYQQQQPCCGGGNTTNVYEGDTYIDNSIYQDNDTWGYQDNDNTNINIDQTTITPPTSPVVVTPDPQPETPVYPVTPDPVVVNDPPSGENGGNGYLDPPSGQNGTADNDGSGYNDPNSGDNGGEGFNDPPSGSGKWEGDAGNGYTYAPVSNLASKEAKLMETTFAPTAKANAVDNQQIVAKQATVSKDNQFYTPSNSAMGKVNQPTQQKYETKSVEPVKVNNTDDKFYTAAPVKQPEATAYNYKPNAAQQPKGNGGDYHYDNNGKKVTGSAPRGNTNSTNAYKPAPDNKVYSQEKNNQATVKGYQPSTGKQNYTSAPKQNVTQKQYAQNYTPQKSNPAPKGGYNTQPRNTAPQQMQRSAPQRNFQQKAPQGSPPSFKGGGKKG